MQNNCSDDDTSEGSQSQALQCQGMTRSSGYMDLAGQSSEKNTAM